ncbi:MAG: hypothetical protein SaHV1_gp2 [Sanya hepevirus 1]|nr:MAG: hypothetical protein SaHV1_gp2 [Sanya hepevirus 1]
MGTAQRPFLSVTAVLTLLLPISATIQPPVRTLWTVTLLWEPARRLCCITFTSPGREPQSRQRSLRLAAPLIPGLRVRSVSASTCGFQPSANRS